MHELVLANRKRPRCTFGSTFENDLLSRWYLPNILVRVTIRNLNRQYLPYLNTYILYPTYIY